MEYVIANKSSSGSLKLYKYGESPDTAEFCEPVEKIKDFCKWIKVGDVIEGTIVVDKETQVRNLTYMKKNKEKSPKHEYAPKPFGFKNSNFKPRTSSPNTYSTPEERAQERESKNKISAMSVASEILVSNLLKVDYKDLDEVLKALNYLFKNVYKELTDKQSYSPTEDNTTKNQEQEIVSDDIDLTDSSNEQEKTISNIVPDKKYKIESTTNTVDKLKNNKKPTFIA